MGERAHIVKVGNACNDLDCGDFNNRSYEVLLLLHKHNVCFSIDKVGRGGRITQWKIDGTDGLDALIANLEESPDELDECFMEDDDDGYKNINIAHVFRKWVKHCDEKDNVIRINWS